MIRPIIMPINVDIASGFNPCNFTSMNHYFKDLTIESQFIITRDCCSAASPVLVVVYNPSLLGMKPLGPYLIGKLNMNRWDGINCLMDCWSTLRYN